MSKRAQKFMVFGLVLLLVFSVFSVVGSGEGFTESHTDIRIIVQKRGVDLEELYDNSDFEVIENYDSYLLMDTSEEAKEFLKKQGAIIETLHNRGHVGLHSYSFNTKEGTPDIPRNIEIENYSKEEMGYYIVQFIGPIRSEWQNEIEKEGAELHEFRHRFNFIVEMDLETKRSVEQKDFVNWVGTYQPAYRFDRELLEDFDEKVIEVSFFDGVNLSESARKIDNIGEGIHNIERNRITAEIHTQRIERVANLEGVNSITEGTERYELYNADATWITQTNIEDNRNVTEKGITGKGELITIMDSELYGGNSDDEDHEMWEDPDGNLVGDDHRKIQAHYVPGNAQGDLNAGQYHGTHVTGSVLGNSLEYESYEYYDGNALDARLIFQDIDDGSDDFIYPPSDMYEDGYGYPYTEWGANIHTNSWGGGSGYEGDAIIADEFIWDHKDYNILYAMGNDGPGSNTLSEQAEGKNVISVGSVINYPYQDEVSTFSSRGYADDGRIKPTILHVGEDLVSAGRGYDDYYYMDGTSMATPGIAGQVGQIRQYYEEGWYLTGAPDEEEGFNPSNALVRATLINGAVEISGDGAYENENRFPNNDQGYGRSRLDRVLQFEGNERKLEVFDSWNENITLDTGESWNIEFEVDDPSQELEVTLAWSDYPGSSGSDEDDPAIVNDLDLELKAPDGTRYVGNAFTEHNPGYSEANPTNNPWNGLREGEYDGLNVEENILLLPNYNGVEEGTYELTVSGYNVPEDTQPFAVTVSGGISEFGPSIEVTNPEGGETWQYGDEETIEWTTYEDEHPIDSVDLEYSIDGGSSYTEIANGLDDTGSYNWTIPDVTSDEAVIRTTVHDEEGLSGRDKSDIFTIEGSPPDPPQKLDVQHAIEEWHWMYEAEHRSEPDTAIGIDVQDTWQGAIRTELPAGEITDVAYYHGDDANSVKATIHEDSIDEPGEQIAETYTFTDFENDKWHEIPLKTSIELDSDHYWILLEIDDPGEEFFPFGMYETSVEDGGYIKHSGTDGWETRDWTWALEVMVREIGGKGSDDNLITWDASPDDPENVSHYNIYRSEEEDGPWDNTTHIDSVDADGSNEYGYIDQEKGMADDIFWWYVVRAVDKFVEDDNEVAVQEPIRPFKVEIYDYDEEAIIEQEYSFSYKVTNIGESEETQTIEFRVEDGLKQTEEVTLGVDDEHHGEFTWTPAKLGFHTLEVSSEDHSDKITIPVIEDANFEVSIRILEREVIEGDEVIVDYEVENTGDADDTQTIEFSIEDNLIDHEEVTLDGGDIHDAEFKWQTEEGDAGRYEIKVSSEDDKDDGRITVYEADIFVVDIRLQEQDKEVVEGDEVKVNYTIRNTKETEDTQEINFTVYEIMRGDEDEFVYSSDEKLTIPAGEVKSGTFTWQTKEGDAGRYRLNVSSEEDYEETFISLLPKDIFHIDIRLGDRDFVDQEDILLNYTVTNTKDEEATQDIVFTIYNHKEELIHQDVKKELNLDSGESHDDEFIWKAEDTDTGKYMIKVASEDDNETSRISVWKADSFAVIVELSDRYRNEILREGRQISIDFSIKNTKEDTETQNIRFYIDDELIETKEEITLEPGEKRDREQFEWTTEEPYGERTLTVESDDDSDEVTIEIGEDAYFEIKINEPEEGQEFERNEEVVVNYTVTNTGDVTGKQTIDFFVNAEKINEREIELESGESESVELLWEADEGTGDYELSVKSRDDEETVTINIVVETNGEDPYFEVKINEPEEGQEFERNEEVVVNYTVTNTGDLSERQTINLIVNGERIDEREFQLESDESKSGEFLWQGEESGDYDLKIESRNDYETVTISIGEESEDEEAVIPGFTLMSLVTIFISIVGIIIAIYILKKFYT